MRKQKNNQQVAMKKMKSTVWKQAVLAMLVIVVTVVLLFAAATAWYTNVVHTGGLMFEVASWGFSGEVTSENPPIKAAPGDSGDVYLTVENSGESAVTASVTIAKNMEEIMQKRLYFYADTPMVRNGEQMERVYINSLESYDYNIFAYNTLNLTEDYHNDARLKWQWVYDLLGYYVRGHVSNGAVQVEEYLRPVEYDYDSAVFVKDETTEKMILTEIEGMKVEDYLKALSETDGYEGTIDLENISQTNDGYYPIRVDEQGNGIYLYLYDYSQIEMAMREDTALGKDAIPAEDKTPATYNARITVSAQKIPVEVKTVRTAAALEEELLAEGDSYIQLGENLQIAPTMLPEDKKVVLDLNGYTLSPASGAWMLDAPEGSCVTISNGKLSGKDLIAVNANGAEITIYNIETDEENTLKRLVNMQDNYGTGINSKVRIVNSDIHVTDIAVFTVGNGEQSEGLSQIIIENTTITSDYFGLSGNGNDTHYGTDITIVDSEITGKWAAIYHPQRDSFMTIVNSYLEGNTALAIKGGTVNITDCEIFGNGKEAIVAPAYGGSGFTDTADGIYVEANYAWTTEVNVYGEKTLIRSDGGKPVRVFEENVTNASITLYAGKLDEGVDNMYLAPDVVLVEKDSYFCVESAKE